MRQDAVIDGETLGGFKRKAGGQLEVGNTGTGTFIDMAAYASHRQHTLKAPIHCSGIGVHSGEKVSMTLRPGEPDTGIVFRRVDAAGEGLELPATWRHAVETPLCTTLADESGRKVMTIEHLMAAFAGCGLDNAVVELAGGEVPVMDGSSAPFVFLIECAGMVEQDAPRKAIRVTKPVSVSEPERSAALLPADAFSIDFEIDFDSPAIAQQFWSGTVEEMLFKQEISRARTFGFLHEVEQMRQMGLALGGSLDNAIVISEDKILNEEGLRYADEFVRHKVLDSIGDLQLAGHRLLAHFTGVKTGHALNLRLLSALFADSDAWELVDIAEAGESPRGSARGGLGRAVAAKA